MPELVIEVEVAARRHFVGPASGRARQSVAASLVGRFRGGGCTSDVVSDRAVRWMLVLYPMDTEVEQPCSRPPSAQLLLDAARELLARRPAPEVTIREIAARAGVQHALIRRHFGSRDGLVRLVVAETLSQFAAAVAAAPDLAAALAVGLEQFASDLALTSGMAMLVVGEDVGELARYPLADAYESQLLRAGVDPRRARDTAVMVIALMSGWMVGQRFWLGMSGRGDDPKAGLAMVEHAVWALIDRAMDDTRATTGRCDQ